MMENNATSRSVGCGGGAAVVGNEANTQSDHPAAAAGLATAWPRPATDRPTDHAQQWGGLRRQIVDAAAAAFTAYFNPKWSYREWPVSE